MGRTPRKYVITPGMHIPARPASAPPGYQPATRPDPKIATPTVRKRTKKHIAPLSTDRPTPKVTIKPLDQTSQDTIDGQAAFSVQVKAPEPVIPAHAASQEPVETAPILVETYHDESTEEADIALLTEVMPEAPHETAPERQRDADIYKEVEHELEPLPIAAEPEAFNETAETQIDEDASYETLTAMTPVEIHKNEPVYEQHEPTDGSHTLLPGAPFGPTGGAPILLEAHNPSPRRYRRSGLPKAVVALMVVLVVSGAATLTFKLTEASTGGLPQSIVSKVTSFTPYYLSQNFKTDFVMVKDSASYNGNTLVFALARPDGKKLTVTEVKTPTNYDTSNLQANEAFDTTYGKAFVVDGESRTTGALFTSDHTWILVTAPAGIATDVIHDVIAHFGPVKH